MESKIKYFLDEFTKFGNYITQEEFDKFERNYNLINGENSCNLVISKLDKIFEECSENFLRITEEECSEKEIESKIITLMNKYKLIYGDNFEKGFFNYCMSINEEIGNSKQLKD
jgi:hypothetical protein